MLGDFNIPNYVNNNNSGPKTFTFNSFLDFVGLQQHNSVLNSFNRLLDLVLSNQLVDVTRDDIPMINEDEYHPALNARIFVKKDKANSVTTSDNLINTYNFRKADFVQLYYQLYAVTINEGSNGMRIPKWFRLLPVARQFYLRKGSDINKSELHSYISRVIIDLQQTKLLRGQIQPHL
nr:unnamed protein product [Callosobruchus analis]